MKRAIIAFLFSIILLVTGCATQTAKEVSQSGDAKKVANKPSDAKHSDTKKANAKSKKKELAYTGLVDTVDLKARTIVLRKEDLNTGFLFDASKAKLNGYTSLKDIKPGDKASATYKVELGKIYALTVSKN